jgi:hypothetical protein
MNTDRHLFFTIDCPTAARGIYCSSPARARWQGGRVAAFGERAATLPRWLYGKRSDGTPKSDAGRMTLPSGTSPGAIGSPPIANTSESSLWPHVTIGASACGKRLPAKSTLISWGPSIATRSPSQRAGTGPACRCWYRCAMSEAADRPPDTESRTEVMTLGCNRIC